MQERAVSIIVPVYNRRDLVVHAVRSLLRQDFHLPYEVVLVDDGSTDDSAAVAARLDPRVRVIRQSHQGAGAARHRGVCEARAPVVTFLDSDDLASPGMLSALWRGLVGRPQAVLSFGKGIEVGGTGSVVPKALTDLNDGMIWDPLSMLLQEGCFVPAMNLMTYRRLVTTCGRSQETFPAANDYDLILRLATRGPFSFVNEVTVCYERRDDGISRTKRPLQAGFAVIAADEAVRFSGRRDPAVAHALRQRVEIVWPWAFVNLAAKHHWRLSAQVFSIGLRRARWLPSLRRLWWALWWRRH